LPELTEEEKEKVIETALFHAKKEKGQILFNAAYSKQISKAPQFPVLSAESFRDIIVNIGIARSRDRKWPEEFKMDDLNKGIINTLSMYFTKDTRFLEINPDFSFQKGILLIGRTGCGKTQLMQLCTDNPKQSYSQHDCPDIVEDYAKKDIGQLVFDQFETNGANNNKDRYFGQPFLGRFFDDLGAEPVGKHMGNERNVIGEIIQLRYKKHPHYFTHFTSNLVMEDLEDFYGARVADRLREMCNVIEFPATAKSRRR